jgi:hypothetical protein
MTPLKFSSVSHKIKIHENPTMSHMFTEPPESPSPLQVPGPNPEPESKDDLNANKTTNDLPLTPEDMTNYLIQHHGKPCVLREEGTDHILCPYCGEPHHHPDTHGHFRAGCADYNFGTHITIGPRSFNPAYGYDIYEYKKITKGTNTHYQIRPLNHCDLQEQPNPP